jgi:POT family proton-dependent oligopeptide transporter
MTDADTPPREHEDQDGHFPPQIKYIIGNEVCERFSYYGMLGILELYLANRMKMGGDVATTTQHLFGTAVYFLPLAGGWLADRWLGRYWTILFISLFYCLGHGTLALFEGSLTGLYVGLGLIAIGAGGIKPCVSAFVGDQFKPSQHHLLTKIYGWFYWAINLGAAAAFFSFL